MILNPLGKIRKAFKILESFFMMMFSLVNSRCDFRSSKMEVFKDHIADIVPLFFPHSLCSVIFLGFPIIACENSL